MRCCRHCRITLANDLETCPLCDMETVCIDGTFDDDYPHIRSGFTRGMLLRMITFIAVVFIAASLLINHLVPTESPWAIITAAAIVYVWLNAMNSLKAAPNPASILLVQLFSVSGFLVLVDWFTGWHHWAITWVIPGLIIIAALALLLMIVIKPHRYRAYTIYQLMIAVLGVLSIFLWVFGMSDVKWPVMTAAGVSLLCFVTMLVFSHRRTGHELVKRFHA